MPYLATLRGSNKVKVFEDPAGGYLSSHLPGEADGFWGPITSSIDWCEHNYAYSPYIAEFWNTVSNFLLVVASLYGLWICSRERLEMRFYVLYALVMIIGLGSLAFHGTLTFVGQFMDEVPMIFCIFNWFFCFLAIDGPSSDRRDSGSKPAHIFFWRMALVFSATCVIYAVLHYIFHFVLIFQVFFGIITAIALRLVVGEIRRCDNPKAKALGISYIVFLVVAFALWNVDQHLCERLYSLPLGIPNPQFHAWWHLINGYTCYVGPMFQVFCRQVKLGRVPRVRFVLGCIPVIECTRDHRGELIRKAR